MTDPHEGPGFLASTGKFWPLCYSSEFRWNPIRHSQLITRATGLPFLDWLQNAQAIEDAAAALDDVPEGTEASDEDVPEGIDLYAYTLGNYALSIATAEPGWSIKKVCRYIENEGNEFELVEGDAEQPQDEERGDANDPPALAEQPTSSEIQRTASSDLNESSESALEPSPTPLTSGSPE